MRHWRPENWKNIVSPAAIQVRDRNGKPISHHEAFELGADAMLEALYEATEGKWRCFDKTDSGDILIYANE